MRFSLRALLVTLTLASFALAVWSKQRRDARQVREAIEFLHSEGAGVGHNWPDHQIKLRCRGSKLSPAGAAMICRAQRVVSLLTTTQPLPEVRQVLHQEFREVPYVGRQSCTLRMGCRSFAAIELVAYSQLVRSPPLPNGSLAWAARWVSAAIWRVGILSDR